MAGERTDVAGKSGYFITALLSALVLLLLYGVNQFDKKVDKSVFEIEIRHFKEGLNDLGDDLDEIKDLIRDHDGGHSGNGRSTG